DPVGCRGRLVVRRSWLWPIRWGGDVADRDRDDPVGVPYRERIIGEVLAEPDHGILVALMIVGAGIDVTGGGVEPEPVQLTDDRVVFGPAAGQFVGALDCVLEHVERGIGAFSLEVRILVPALVVAANKGFVDRPAVAARVGEVIIGVDTGEDTFGVVLADRVR